MDYSKVTDLISAMAMSALNGVSVHPLHYGNGNIVYAVLQKFQKSNSAVPKNIQNQMKKNKKKSNRRKTSKKKSTRRKTSKKKSTRRKTR